MLAVANVANFEHQRLDVPGEFNAVMQEIKERHAKLLKEHKSGAESGSIDFDRFNSEVASVKSDLKEFQKKFPTYYEDFKQSLIIADQQNNIVAFLQQYGNDRLMLLERALGDRNAVVASAIRALTPDIDKNNLLLRKVLNSDMDFTKRLVPDVLSLYGTKGVSILIELVKCSTEGKGEILLDILNKSNMDVSLYVSDLEKIFYSSNAKSQLSITGMLSQVAGSESLAQDLFIHCCVLFNNRQSLTSRGIEEVSVKIREADTEEALNEKLFNLLLTGDKNVQLRAGATMGEVGTSIAPWLLEAFKIGNTGCRVAALIGLHAAYKESENYPIETIVSALNDKAVAVQATAVDILASSKKCNEAAMVSLKFQFKYSSSSYLRATIARSFREFSPLAKMTIPDLIHALKNDEDAQTRFEAFKAALLIGGKVEGVVRQLFCALEDKSSLVRNSAIDAMARMPRRMFRRPFQSEIQRKVAAAVKLPPEDGRAIEKMLFSPKLQG